MSVYERAGAIRTGPFELEHRSEALHIVAGQVDTVLLSTTFVAASTSCSKLDRAGTRVTGNGGNAYFDAWNQEIKRQL